MRHLVILALPFALLASACVARFDAPADYDGNWQGTWSVPNTVSQGDIEMTLENSGESVTGQVSLSGTVLCISSGTLSGEVSNDGLVASFTNDIGTVQIDGAIDATDKFTGTFDVTQGLCAGTSGNFSMSR